jgi:hypothetical protein
VAADKRTRLYQHGQASAEPPVAEDMDSSQLVMMPGPAQPQPRTGKPVKSSLLDSMVRRVAALFQSADGHKQARAPRENSTIYAQHPGLQIPGTANGAARPPGEAENQLMAKTEGYLGQGVGNLRDVMRRTGINPDVFARKIAARTAWAGRKSR